MYYLRYFVHVVLVLKINLPACDKKPWETKLYHGPYGTKKIASGFLNQKRRPADGGMDGGAYETAVLNLAVQVLNLVRASLFCSCLSVGPRAR